MDFSDYITFLKNNIDFDANFTQKLQTIRQYPKNKNRAKNFHMPFNSQFMPLLPSGFHPNIHQIIQIPTNGNLCRYWFENWFLKKKKVKKIPIGEKY